MFRNAGMFKGALSICPAVGLALLLSSCADLLPRAKQETQTPWRSYAEAYVMFEQIVPGKTHLADLKALKIDPDQTPNVALLSHADLLRRLFPATSYDADKIEPGLRACMSSQHNCFAYEIEQVSLDRRRFGNFWADFFNFRREVDISGWRFNAVIVVKGDSVVYKMWSGKPNVHQIEDESTPLGPFQSLGPSLLTK